MKQDPRLRAMLKARRLAGTREATAADVQHAEQLVFAYKVPRTALDADAAIAELDSDADISPELRYALILLLKGKITMKRGRKGGSASAMRTRLAAYAAFVKHRDQHVPMRQAINEEATRLGVTTHAVNALIYPRKRLRKSA